MSAEDPGVIRRLDEVVVNRIAAGEIIKRPANALKEMIENSLDAKSTTIQITVKDGGLKFLQIQDNGTGIRKDDLAIICERFTTSKLQTFDDLSTMSTYGFRGEALASISHVAHLTIQTKTRNSACAYRASYTDSRLNGTVKPAAGNQGTQITVEDLFYNVPQRRQALRSASDEMARISDVVSRYAVHNPHVAFALRKLGDAGAPAVRTVVNATHRQNIACIYGTDVAKDLVEIRLDNAMLRARAYGLVTNVNYASKKSTMLLFINHRLVESAALKAALDQIYATYLPKGSHPFVYVSLHIDAANVDVNVHPTKHEVHFLHEDEIIESVRAEVERTLLGNNEARKFYAQTLLPGASEPSTQSPAAAAAANRSTSTQAPLVYDKNMVRTDSKEQKLERFFGNATLLSATLSGASMMSTADETEQLIGASDDDEDANATGQTTLKSMSRLSQLPSTNTYRARKFNVLRKQTKLTSILRMRQICERQCDLELRRQLSELTFVGVVDRRRALIQHDTKMFLCDTQRLSTEIFYQILLYDFENFGGIRLDAAGDGLAIRELAALALASEESGWTEADGSIADLASSVHDIFIQKRAILSEYYGLEIDADGRLRQLPMLLENHVPSMAHLPMYMLRLATEVNWDEEQPFFETFSRETATYYAIIPVATTTVTSSEGDTVDDSETKAEVENGGPLSWRWYVEHVMYAALKEYLLPPKEFMHNGCFLQVANLANLYKVFERC